MRREESQKKTTVLGRAGSSKKRGRPGMRWTDSIKQTTALCKTWAKLLTRERFGGHSFMGYHIGIRKPVNTHVCAHTFTLLQLTWDLQDDEHCPEQEGTTLQQAFKNQKSVILPGMHSLKCTRIDHYLIKEQIKILLLLQHQKHKAETKVFRETFPRATL